MVWIILSAIVFAASLVLAAITFFKSRKVVKSLAPSLALFVVQNPSALTSTLLTQVFSSSDATSSLLSFEIVIKENSHALIFFWPRSLLEQYPQLKALEIEDYTNSIDKASLIVLQFRPQNQATSVPADFIKALFGSAAAPNDQIYYQLVSIKDPSNASSGVYANLRILIASLDEARRQKLKDDLTSFISRNAHLNLVASDTPEEEAIKYFFNRSFSQDTSLQLKLSFDDLGNLIN